MDNQRKVDLSIIVTLALAVISLAFYFGRLDHESVSQKEQIVKLQEEIKNLDDTSIKKAQKEALIAISNIEKKLVSYNFKPLDQRVANIERMENVRTIISKKQADSFCPSPSTAIHVPRGYLGKTGNEICQADQRKKNRCAAVNFVFVTNENGTGTYQPNDLGCAENVNFSWPWGLSYSTPDSLNNEWGHGNTWVTCCF